MNQSITKKITRRVSILLIFALVSLLTGSYFLVQHIILSKSRTYANAITSVFADVIAFEAYNECVPIDADYSDNILIFADYLCEWYSIENAYVYIPDLRNEKITILALSQNNLNKDSSFENSVHYVLSPEEIAVWNGDKVLSTVNRKDLFGKNMVSSIKFADNFGNNLMASVSISKSSIHKQIINTFLILAAIILLVFLGILITVVFTIREMVSRPAKILSKSMEDFIRDGKRSDVLLEDSGNDEYSKIARAFNKMTKNIDSYLENISNLTRIQEQQNTQLYIASRIQKGFLKDELFNTCSCQINALMIPAKDVGGDFYDYVMLTDNRVLIAIADVSGKGISASLFMAVTLMLVRQYAKMNLLPSEILENTNNVLSESNLALLFASAFIGIYDGNTKTFTYSNAGHNIPYVVNKNVRDLSEAKGSVLGLFADEKYTDSTINLSQDDIIFLYTDGVNESVNSSNEFYGMGRLIENLKDINSAKPKNTVSFVYDKLKAFVNDANQHDDITMLTLKVTDNTNLLLDYNIKEFEKIKNLILTLPLPRNEQLRFCLAAEECFVNICSYAFPGGVPENEKINVILSVNDKIELCFSDGGEPFNPLKNAVDIEDYDIDSQIGGLGNFLAFSNVDDVRYEYKNNKNVLTLIKNFKEE